MSGADGVTPENPGASAGGASDVLRSAFDDKHFLLAAAKRVFVGYSGGVDSTVLLATAAERYGAKLIALHANHALHDDATLWQQHCNAVCGECKVPLRSVELELRPEGRGLEAAARKARYAWFAQQLDSDGDVLLLAHHRDDQAETLVLRLLRGAGPDGLGGMPEARPLGAGMLLRPLLDVPRSVLIKEAQRRKLSWIDDPSNDDDRFDRNYLRKHVMPLLARRWPGSSATIARAAKLLREESTALTALAPQLCRSVVGDPGLSYTALAADAPRAALELRAWLRRAGVQAPSAARLKEFLRQCHEGRGAELVLGDAALTRYREQLYLHPLPGPMQAVALQAELDTPLRIDGIGRVTLHRDATRASEPLPRLELRLRSGGERLAGEDGHHRELKKLCQERGIPPWWRGRMPLLFELTPAGPELLAAGSLSASPRCRELGLELRWSPPVLRVEEADATLSGWGID